MIRNKKNGFTLVELLAVIVILAVILVIAVPQIMSTIELSRKGSLESSAKLVASSAETLKLANDTLGISEKIKCEDVAEFNSENFQSCKIEFDDSGNALVTMVGKGKFDGMKIVAGTKENASVVETTGVDTLAGLQLEENVLKNGLSKTTASYTNSKDEIVELDAGIRYIGASDEVNNYVYFNCEDTDGINDYGTKNFNYESSCEKWRIIGVFEVDNGEGDIEERIKIINNASTFEASWDISDSTINGGMGVNQWGPSSLTDGTEHLGSDMMLLLNGFYIGNVNSECKYHIKTTDGHPEQECTKESLTNVNMKPLTSKSMSFIDDAVWYTYAANTANKNMVYLQERGIINKYSGCLDTEVSVCSKDIVKRDNIWIGKVGLMYSSDIVYANGWLNKDNYAWSISPFAHPSGGNAAILAYTTGIANTSTNRSFNIWPSVYLKSNVKLNGKGTISEPFKLSL